MNSEYWINRWNQNQTGFHRAEVNPLLPQFWPLVSVAVPSGSKVLVPLCGKSIDLRWLAERGHEVVGVELSLLAAKGFAAEQGIVLTESHEPPFTVLRSNKVTYYIGDFFDFTTEIVGQFDLFYDRAALIALPPEMRPGYVRHLQSLVRKGAPGLLIGLEYDPSQMHGPPFPVPDAEVRRLFESFNCEKLVEYDCLEQEPHFKQRGLTWLKESAYALGVSR
jgi:thiopurine S-methyltransferase